MQCTISARRKEQEHMDYLAIREHGLEAIDENEGGDGSVKNPYHKKIKITNKNDTVWSGVIHVEVTFTKKNPRYFLPAFMYGRNRGQVHPL